MPPNIPIPQYVQQTEPTYTPATRRLEAPPVEGPNIGGALTGLGNQLMGIWQVQQDHQKALDLADKTADYDLKSVDARVKAMTQPGQQMGQFYKNETDQIIKDMLADPANAHISQELGVALKQQQAQGIEQMTLEGVKATAEDQAIQLKNQATKAAATAASKYTPVENKEGGVSFINAPDAIAAKAAYYALVDNQFPIKTQPNQNAAYKANFEHQIIVQRGETVALAQPQMMDEYIKQNSGSLTADEQHALITRATEAIRAPNTRLDAVNDNIRASLYDKFSKQALAGNLNMAQLTEARQKQLIEEKDFEHFAGVPYVEPSDPATLQGALDRINATNDPEELKALDVAYRSNSNIRGKGAIQIAGAVAAKVREAGTIGGRAKIEAEERIRKAYDVSTIDDQINDKLNPGQRAAALRGALADWNAATEHETDRATILTAAEKAIQANPRPQAITTKKGPMVVPRTGMTDQEKLKWGRDHGLIN